MTRSSERRPRVKGAATVTPPPVDRLVVRPLSSARWPDLERVFGARGCGVARSCWCMHYRRSGKVAVPAGVPASVFNRRALAARVEADEFTGLLGYSGRDPVGWVACGPRAAFPKLARSPVLRPVDADGGAADVWSIVCFVVPGPQRGRGVARALLGGVIEYARRRRIAALEAYPVDRAGRSDDQSMWFGAKSMFDAAGFVEVARRRPERPIVRLALSPPDSTRRRG